MSTEQCVDNVLTELTKYRDMLITLEETERLEAFDYRGAAAEVASGSGIDLSDVPLTEDHESKKDEILAWQNEYLELLDDSEDVPPYDPLKPLADEILEEIENGQYTYNELESLMEQMSNLPILLTDATLNNPYALLYADLLSIRTVTNESQRMRIKMALEQLRKEVAFVDNPKQLLYIQYVHEMLAAKLYSKADVAAAIDEMALNIPSKIPFEEIFGEDGSAYQQYVYLTSFSAVEQANPVEYRIAGGFTETLGWLSTGYSVLYAEDKLIELWKVFVDQYIEYAAEVLEELIK